MKKHKKKRSKNLSWIFEILAKFRGKLRKKGRKPNFEKLQNSQEKEGKWDELILAYIIQKFTAKPHLSSRLAHDKVFWILMILL